MEQEKSGQREGRTEWLKEEGNDIMTVDPAAIDNIGRERAPAVSSVFIYGDKATHTVTGSALFAPSRSSCYCSLLLFSVLLLHILL